MKQINEWWEEMSANNLTGSIDKPLHIASLYWSWDRYYDRTVVDPDWIDQNQFAKCLVKAHICDIGNGMWRLLPLWQPKAYEIARARVRTH
jgi:hypothetical protein